jgi:hypothetical protein
LEVVVCDKKRDNVIVQYSGAALSAIGWPRL